MSSTNSLGLSLGENLNNNASASAISAVSMEVNLGDDFDNDRGGDVEDRREREHVGDVDSEAGDDLGLRLVASGDERVNQARIESWLDEHPEFFQEYLIRKGTRCMVDSWLLAHALPPGSITTTLTNVTETDEDDELCELTRNIPPVGGGGGGPEGGSGSTVTASRAIPPGGPNSGSKNSSGSGTPVRKISAHEFERGGLTKPLVNTVDGAQTFLSPPVAAESVTGTVRKRSRNDLDIQGLNETDLILELVKDICEDLDIRSLCHKILQNVGILTSADRCSLFIVQGEAGTDSHCLVSDLFDVNINSTVEDMTNKKEIRIPWGSGIVGHVAATARPVNIRDCYADDRFNREVDIMTGYRTRSMMCHPILDGQGEVIGVAQVINKGRRHEGHPGLILEQQNNGSTEADAFGPGDEAVVEKYLPFCGIGLRNAQIYERSQLEVKRNQVLLDLAGVIFQEQSTIDNMIHRILTHMLSLIRCDRAMLLLVHEASKNTFSRVFDLAASELDLDEVVVASSREGRFPINAGITGYVAATAETVNITDAYADPRFDSAVDVESDFKHATVLAMPIMYPNKPGKVLGVFQLVNKFEELPFTKNDENFVEAFGIFCGMGIHNVHMYEKTVVAMAKQQVTLEVLSYHATAALEEAQKLARLKIPSAAALQLHSFSFDDFGLGNDEMLQAALRMFIDLDFLGRFHIDYTVLCRWLVSVRKNYRAVTYHNWRHAFNVAQMMFATVTSTHWWKKFGEVEVLSLVIGCLCHDLDHRGTNNSFQVKSRTKLAELYSTSTMEHHHFDQCLMILNSKGNQILANLSQDEFKRVISTLEDSILATDLAVYFRRREETFNLINSGQVDFVNDHHRSLVRGLLMTACDLGAITKPWPIQRKVALLVADEFFYQGDLEKNQLKVEPIDMMNREKKDRLPTMQVDFINSICQPVYESLSSLSDSLCPMLAGCMTNKDQWLRLAEKDSSDAWNELENEDTTLVDEVEAQN